MTVNYQNANYPAYNPATVFRLRPDVARYTNTMARKSGDGGGGGGGGSAAKVKKSQVKRAKKTDSEKTDKDDKKSEEDEVSGSDTS